MCHMCLKMQKFQSLQSFCSYIKMFATFARVATGLSAAGSGLSQHCPLSVAPALDMANIGTARDVYTYFYITLGEVTRIWADAGKITVDADPPMARASYWGLREAGSGLNCLRVLACRSP